MRRNEEGRPAEHVPFGQILFENTFFLLFLGVAIPLIFYTVWGLLDVGSVPPLPAGVGQVQELQKPGPPATERHPGEGEKVTEMPPNAQKIEVVATDFAFEPARFTVQADRPVAVTVINADLAYATAPIPVSFPPAAYAALGLLGGGALIATTGLFLYIGIAMASLLFGRRIPASQQGPVAAGGHVSRYAIEERASGTLVLVFILVWIGNAVQLSRVWPVQ